MTQLEQQIAPVETAPARGDKILRVLREETNNLHPRLLFAQMICALLPVHTGYRVRAAALRMVGFHIGRGTMFYDLPAISGSDELHNNLVIGKACRFNLRTSLELGARITIGDNVGVGAETMFLTTSHEFGPAERRCGPQRKGPITIGNGVWIGVRSTILPGVIIGDGAVIAAGSLVNRDVASNTLVAGVPAKQLKELA
jgi:acetyltransferase-like isoleucine patch superfamily enzyme